MKKKSRKKTYSKEELLKLSKEELVEIVEAKQNRIEYLKDVIDDLDVTFCMMCSKYKSDDIEWYDCSGCKKTICESCVHYIDKKDFCRKCYTKYKQRKEEEKRDNN